MNGLLFAINRALDLNQYEESEWIAEKGGSMWIPGRQTENQMQIMLHTFIIAIPGGKVILTYFVRVVKCNTFYIPDRVEIWLEKLGLD